MKMLIEVEINIDLETSEWTKETLLQVLSSQLHNIDLLEEDEYIKHVTLFEGDICSPFLGSGSLENEERRMKVGDIVYHPQFRREGQYTGSGIVREVEDKDRWDNVNVLVQWSGGVEEWYIQEELALEKENEE